MAEMKNMVIYFTDGSKVAYDFPQQFKEQAVLAKHIEKVLTMPFLVIEAENAIMLYPRENIKSIQIYPAPEKLPEFVIKGAITADLY